jgi:diphthamide biosynthesis protein 2
MHAITAWQPTTMATAFSAPDEAILTSTVELSALTLSSTSSSRKIPVYELYDVPFLASQILRGQFRRIALQFPDELLCDSSQVLWSIQAELKRTRKEQQRETTVTDSNDDHQLFILADTSYGNCCVDEVAAEHVDADLVIHFGHACLSLTARLPVIYVFHKLPIDVGHAAECLSASVIEGNDRLDAKKLVVMYDVGYEHASQEISTRLKAIVGRDVFLSQTDKNVNFERFLEGKAEAKSIGQSNGHSLPETIPSTSTCKNSLPNGLDASEVAVLYIGPESLALTNLVLRLGPLAEVISYDAETRKARTETGSTNKLLQRRYFAVQKARDAQTIALLIGTLGIRSYLPLLSSLRQHLTQIQNKKVYTISVGKLNPAKLANFQEIDVFVLIACPENSLVEAKEVQRSREFFRPIVTPFEILTAFKGREWSGEYVLDLETVLNDLGQQQNDKKDQVDDDSGDEQPHFSLITGGLVSNKSRISKDREGDRADTGQGIVTVRNSEGVLTRVMDSAGGQHIASRSWRGLEPRLGMDEAAPLEIGRAGIAKGYVDGSEERAEGH